MYILEGKYEDLDWEWIDEAKSKVEILSLLSEYCFAFNGFNLVLYAQYEKAGAAEWLFRIKEESDA